MAALWSAVLSRDGSLIYGESTNSWPPAPLPNPTKSFCHLHRAIPFLQMLRNLLACLLAGESAALQAKNSPDILQPPLVTVGFESSNSTGVCVGPDCGCPHACSGHGSCSNGECQCFPGFTYYDCSLREAPHPANPRSSSLSALGACPYL